MSKKIEAHSKKGVDKNLTELTWLDKRKQVEIIKDLPFQTIERINATKDRDLLYSEDKEWTNKLIWGDNRYVMCALLEKFQGQIDLIYIDPPFATGNDFSVKIKVGDLEFTKEPGIIEQKAYDDTWGKGVDSYLQMIYDRLVLMQGLLRDTGSIYVHLDWRVGHYVKLVMDEIFGKENFRNEISWRRQIPRGMKAYAEFFPFSADYILIYTKTQNAKWNPQIKVNKLTIPEAEKKYARDRKGFFRTSDPGTSSFESLLKLYEEDMLYAPYASKIIIDKKNKTITASKGKIGIKYYRRQEGKYVIEETTVDNIWDDIPGMGIVSSEWIGFPTQKPKELLERIIKSSSNNGDIVADFFCGSGTTLAVAEMLERKWIGCDLGKFAIQVTRKRLLDIQNCKPFEILNIAKYQTHKFMMSDGGVDAQEEYLKFIAQLFRGERIDGYIHIHGIKNSRYIHIGTTENPVTQSEVENFVEELESAKNSKGDILGWEFEMGLDNYIQEINKKKKMDLKLYLIPKEVLQVKDPVKEEVKFYEMPYLEIDVKTQKDSAVEIKLKDFMLFNQEDIPEEVRKKIKKFSDYIDYWSIDFNYKDVYHNGWQSFRSKKHPNLDIQTKHTYPKKGVYKIFVKVVDIFGNDVNKLVEAKV